jgi:hypothetical protein
VSLLLETWRRYDWKPELPADARIHRDDYPRSRGLNANFIDEHLMEQIESQENLALLDPETRVLVLICRDEGLRISEALTLKTDCLKKTPAGRWALAHYMSKDKSYRVIPASRVVVDAVGINSVTPSAHGWRMPASPDARSARSSGTPPGRCRSTTPGFLTTHCAVSTRRSTRSASTSRAKPSVSNPTATCPASSGWPRRSAAVCTRLPEAGAAGAGASGMVTSRGTWPCRRLGYCAYSSNSYRE